MINKISALLVVPLIVVVVVWMFYRHADGVSVQDKSTGVELAGSDQSIRQPKANKSITEQHTFKKKSSLSYAEKSSARMDNGEQPVKDLDWVKKRLSALSIDEQMDALGDCYYVYREKIEYIQSIINSTYIEALKDVCNVVDQKMHDDILSELMEDPELIARQEGLHAQSVELEAQLDQVGEGKDADEATVEQIRFLTHKLYEGNCAGCGILFRQVVRANPEPLAQWLNWPVDQLAEYNRMRVDMFLNAVLFIQCVWGIEDCSPDSSGAIMDCLADASVCGSDRITGMQLQIGSLQMRWVVTLANFFLAVSGFPAMEHPVLYPAFRENAGE